ncbi:MAG: MBL fold metallo-hydrolase [Bacteroidota bacterium]
MPDPLLKYSLICLLSVGLYACQSDTASPNIALTNTSKAAGPFLQILGIAQDAGYPQAACQKACCKSIWGQRKAYQMVASIGISDPASGQCWMLDATPDFKEQLQLLTQTEPGRDDYTLAGIFLTHAHIGHYTGLMHLGREVMGAKSVPVFAMPRMRWFLSGNGPWSQLVKLQNVNLHALTADSSIQLNNQLKIMPFLVPHRDEFSETVGYRIEGPSQTCIYIPDIDKWHDWKHSIDSLIQEVDLAFLDGTFYQNGEIPGRDMSEIPHPFVEESIDVFRNLPLDERKKVWFIHLNHTNPLLNPDSEAVKAVRKAGHQVARQDLRFDL